MQAFADNVEQGRDSVPAVRANQTSWVPWTADEANAFGKVPLVAKHRLRESPLFSDAGIIELLDSHPRSLIQIFTMGADEKRRDEWQPVAVGEVSGKQIWEAIGRGRLWCKLLHVRTDPRHKTLLEQLYGELVVRCPGFRPLTPQATLLVSSPTAQVYYHADPQPNLLWHIRGTKRVWVYPSGDRELISQELMEDIFASRVDEEAPYEPRFDRKATVFELMPGEVISWPQNAPHRIVNQHDINVSLSTVHETEESDRRKLVYCANRLLRRRLHVPVRSVRETGIVPYGKRVAFRAFRRLRLLETPIRRAYLTNSRVDPSAPEGLGPVSDGPILTEFSRKDFRLERDKGGNAFAVPIAS